MIGTCTAHPSTARLPLDFKNTTSSYSSKSNLPRINTSRGVKGMQPHGRLPGVHQLLTPTSPPPFGRGQSQANGVGGPPQSRSSLPLEDILCPSDQPLGSSSKSYPSPPQLTNTTQTSQSSYYTSVGQYGNQLSRPSPPQLGRPPSYPNGMNYQHQTLSDGYYSYGQSNTRPSSSSTSRSSGHSSTIMPSIPPPTQARLVGTQHFVGEGECWVYDDGTHIRKEIDGEAVNPQWGVTKAGKPRKRLAQACLTCREKKIKCDLADPKCLQCDKSGRECRYATARASRRAGSSG